MPRFSAPVEFTVRHDFDVPSEVLWRELVDWEAHAEWIPATRMEVPEGDPTSIGFEFTAITGYGPLRLVDRMRVERCDWDGTTGRCEVAKLGPILRGRAGFTVTPLDSGRSRIDWLEDVTVPWVPRFLGGVVARIGALGFGQGMKSLARRLR